MTSPSPVADSDILFLLLMTSFSFFAGGRVLGSPGHAIAAFSGSWRSESSIMVSRTAVGKAAKRRGWRLLLKIHKKVVVVSRTTQKINQAKQRKNLAEHKRRNKILTN
jgi:hypothetical protein